MSEKELAKVMASFEIGWWEDHHRKNKKGLTEKMAKLYTLLFNISYEDAVTIVQHRVEAAELHDKAEEFEDEGGQKIADMYWDEAEKELQKHFALLEQLRKR